MASPGREANGLLADVESEDGVEVESEEFENKEAAPVDERTDVVADEVAFVPAAVVGWPITCG